MKIRIRLLRRPMPRYAYRCDKCENILEITHSIMEKLEICEECNGSLVRVPSETFIKFRHRDTKRKVGEIVKNHIEESREELKQQQRRINVEEHK